jgi:hypothetical protein
MLTVPKLLGPRRGTPWPRFALDERGLLPTDTCITLSQPSTAGARIQLGRVRDTLSRHLARTVSTRDLLVYVIAFLNAAPAAAALRIGRLPTAKGGWTIDEDYVTRVRISVPDDSALVQELWSRSDSFVTRTGRGEDAREDRERLEDLVGRALGLDAAVRHELATWAAEVMPPTER